MVHDIPERWIFTPAHSQTLPPDDEWWHGFNDPMLDSLISEAVDRNYNVAIAARRIDAANAAIMSARSSYFPMVGVSASYDLSRRSGNLTAVPGPAVNSRALNLGVNASWEIDLFGRVASSVKEKKALSGVARADYDAVMVSLCSSLASAYMDLRASQAQGGCSDEPSRQSERGAAHHPGTLQGIARVWARCSASQHRLRLHSRLPPVDTHLHSLVYQRHSTPFGALPRRSRLPPVASGSGACLQPYSVDSRTGRAAQAASRHHIGRAHSRSPGCRSRSGTKGVYANAVDSRLIWGGGTRSRQSLSEAQHHLFGGADFESWTVFDGFGRRAAVQEARAQLEIALDSYHQTVLSATSEVENALSSYINAIDYVAQLEKVVDSAREEVNLSLAQYRSGLTLFTPVAQAQITYLQYDDELVAARASESRALIDLYRALGGGYGYSSADGSSSAIPK